MWLLLYETTECVLNIFAHPSLQHLQGSSRSLVRRIGSSLPIDTGRRLYVRVSTHTQYYTHKMHTGAKKTTFYPEIPKNLVKNEVLKMWILTKMRFWKCEFCQKWGFENVNFVKNEILKMWILWKMRLWKCEFCQKWDFENVNLVKNEILKMWISWKVWIFG